MLGKKKRAYEPEELSARARLRANLGDMLARNEVPANRIAELANDINRVAPAELSNLKRPRWEQCCKEVEEKIFKEKPMDARLPGRCSYLESKDPKNSEQYAANAAAA